MSRTGTARRLDLLILLVAAVAVGLPINREVSDDLQWKLGGDHGEVDGLPLLDPSRSRSCDWGAISWRPSSW